MSEKSPVHWWSKELSEDQVKRIIAVSQECRTEVTKLIDDDHIKLVLEEEKIDAKIDAYLEEHWERLKAFVWKTGKIFVPMDSAEHFADIVIAKLWPEWWVRIVKYKVSTTDWVESTGKEISAEDKVIIDGMMNLQEGENVLILEDLFDTCFTVKMLHGHFIQSKPWVNVKTLCLFDKEMHKNHIDLEEREEIARVRDELWDWIESIIDIWNEFAIWKWMDYENRLCSRMKSLWKVTKDSQELFCEIVNPYAERIQEIIDEKEAA